MMLRIAIVDDEPLARERLCSLLQGEADVQIVAQCGDGEAAIEALSKTAVDAVFLDVRMPGLDGFDVLEALGPERDLQVIFLTAHEEHAVRAFETRATDYLLKPVSRARLAESLDRVRERLRQVPREKRIAVRDASRVLFVSVRDVDWIEAAGNYAVLHAGDRTHIVRETMSALDRFLSDDGFRRINRGVIVNLGRVSAVENRDGRVIVRMRDGAEVSSARSLREIQALLQR